MSDFPCGCSIITPEEVDRIDPGHILPDLVAPKVFAGMGFIDGKLCDYVYCTSHRKYWSVQPYEELT